MSREADIDSLVAPAAWGAARADVAAVSPFRLADAPAGDELVLFIEEDGTGWVGVGSVLRWAAGAAQGATVLWAEVAAALKAIGGEASGVRAFGRMVFDADRPLDPFGAEIPAASFHVPRWLLRFPPQATFGEGVPEAWVLWSATAGPEALASELDRFRAWVARARRPERQPVVRVVPDEAERADFERAVGGALSAIARGEARKVVLARPRYLEAKAHLPVRRIFEQLARRAPGTSRFLFVARDGAAFLGASPECLVALDGRRVRADVLAGTCARAAEPAEDARLAHGLLQSDKDRHEHALVREAVLAALAPFVTQLDAPEEPTLLPLPNVWHLRTPVAAVLASEAGLGDLVAALHPTPAVGGVPRETAVRLIGELELTGRGYYAGPVGWMSADAAFLAVGIRAAHVRGNRAAALAGAGVVAGSRPDAEWLETERKLAPMLAALTEAPPP